MTEENKPESGETLRVRAELQEKTIRYLQKTVQKKNHALHALRDEVVRQHQSACNSEEKATDAQRVVETLRTDMRRLLEAHDAAPLYRELARLRRDYKELRATRAVWQGITRKAVEAKAYEAERARDLEEVVSGLREKVTEVERQRDDVNSSAEEATQALVASRGRIADQCGRWRRGVLDSMTALAAITAEMYGYPMPEPGSWEREQEIKSAKLRSQVKILEEKVSETDTDERRARSFAMQLLDLFGKGGGALGALVQFGRYDEALKELKRG